MENNIQRRRRK